MNNQVLNTKQNISFCALRVTKSGAAALADNFIENKQYLKQLITSQEDNIAADIFVHQNNIYIKPHPATGLASMKMRALGNREVYGRHDGYFVDYMAYDVYDKMNNGYYTISKHSNSNLPKFPNLSFLNSYEKLFDGACHIADDIRKKYSAKVIAANSSEIKVKKFISELNLDLFD